MGTRGRPASLPTFEQAKEPHGYEAQPGKLSVQLALENDPWYEFNLASASGSLQLRRDLLPAVAAWSAGGGRSGGGKRVSTVNYRRFALGVFLAWTDQRHRTLDLSTLTQADLDQFKDHLNRTRSRGSSKSIYSSVVHLLSFSKIVPELTRRGLRTRGTNNIPQQKSQSPKRYSEEEFNRIKHSARRVVEAALARIEPHYVLAVADPDSDDSDDPAMRARAHAWREVLRDGQPSSLEGFRALGEQYVRRERRRREREGLLNTTRRGLFPSGDEVLAGVALMACHRGLNLSPLISTSKPTLHSDGIVQLDLDKPRRGKARYWPELVDVTDEDGAAAVLLVERMTEPARHSLALRGKSTNRLVVYLPHGYGLEWMKFGIPHDRQSAFWIPEGTRLHFGQLRRSVPGEGVQKEPTHHDRDTYLHYVRTDPKLLEEYRIKAAKGIEKAVERARAEVKMRRVSEDEAPPEEHDSALSGCDDPQDHPTTHAPCESAFVDPLLCLFCDNSASTARHLPRQLAFLAELDDMRNQLDEERWQLRWRQRWAALRAAVEEPNFTKEEREAAAEAADAWRSTARAILRKDGEVPWPTDQ